VQRDVIGLLVDAGANIDHVEKGGATPLHRAVRARSPEAVRCLLERGASVHARHGKQGSTPLDLARHSTGASGTKGAGTERDEIVALLLQHGARPGAPGTKGRSIG
jgi:ankyrin repeat protein